MRTILITGGTGLVGGDILRYLHGNNWRVIMATSTRGVVSVDERVRVVPFDLSSVTENPDLVAVMSDSDAVIHSAAILPSSRYLHDPRLARNLFIMNTIGTFELMELAVVHQVPHFIFISRMFDPAVEEICKAVPARPINYYRVSKWLGEQIADFFGRRGQTKFCTLCISAPYGPGYKAKAVIPTFVEGALAGRDIQLWGSGSREQTFTYVRDISRACELVLQQGTVGNYNVAGPGPVTMKALAEAVLDVVRNTGSRVVFTGKPDPDKGLKSRISIEAARQAFGYVPLYDIHAGITDMVSNIRSKPQPLYLSKSA